MIDTFRHEHRYNTFRHEHRYNAFRHEHRYNTFRHEHRYYAFLSHFFCVLIFFTVCTHKKDTVKMK